MTTSRMHQTLAAKPHVWGGWITGPTAFGPEEFARAGYDYVGFDTQHGYLDDADVANILERLGEVPIATAVRLPGPAAAPIGRVLDAGADAVIIAMIETAEQAAAAVAATRYPPDGARSFGPLRPDLGHDPAELGDRAAVFAMVETVRGVQNVAEICAVAGLSGIYVGPVDLSMSMGHGPRGVAEVTEVMDTVEYIRRTTVAAGLITAVHAGDGVAGNAMAARGFQMITLASERRSLNRGAGAHLAEATAQSADDPSGVPTPRGYS